MTPPAKQQKGIEDNDFARRDGHDELLTMGGQLGDLSNNVNLQHLLRATNHLKIAQNEFDMARKMLN